MLNASLLSVLLAVLLLTVAVLAPLEPNDGTLAEIITATACMGLAVAFYRGSIGRAVAWGSEVKAAFDLHRRTLLSALGIEFEPTTLVEERKLWREVRMQLTFLDPWDGSAPPLVFVPPALPASPRILAGEGASGLRLTRGVQPVEGNQLRVVIEVENTLAEPRTNVVIVDELPPEWDYVWATATVGEEQALAYGDRALQIPLGELPAAGRAKATYRMLPRTLRINNTRKD